MDAICLKLKLLFLTANERLLSDDILLFENYVSERTLCGALSQQLKKILCETEFSSYFDDVEYNRNKDKKIKTCCIWNGVSDYKIVNINCDLIVHSRGRNIEQDNLIALEMKKSYRKEESKNFDKLRLISLTSDSFDNIWSFDGKILPRHVCRYKLGIYYEVNYKERCIFLEYYYKGKCVSKDNIRY